MGQLMQPLTIAEPTVQDRAAVLDLFREVMEDLYKREGIFESFHDEMHSELREKEAALTRFIEARSEIPYFLVAKIGGQCVGTIALTMPNDLITDSLPEVMAETPLLIPEVSSVFVLPGFQGQGIGLALLAAVKEALKQKGLSRFCLDCGYPKSQPYWLRHLGKPARILENQWGVGLHHMIWLMAVK